MSAVGIFSGTCGENSSATGSLESNQTVQLNGNTELDSCIRGNDDACVFGITLTGSPGVYDYVLNVDARGPKGIGSGCFYLAVTDESPDTYHLEICSSTRSTHTVRYNSKSPAIKKIQWSNHSID